MPDASGHNAEIGYWTASAEWGQGFASEAASTVTRFALGNGVRRVHIHCAMENLASARVALACGFSYEGIQRGFVVRGRTMTGPVFSRLPEDNGAPIAPAWPSLDHLTDGEVLVRPMSAQDWPVLLSERNNAESLEWSFTGEPTDEAEARAEAARAGLDWLVSHKARFVMCDAATGEAAGTLYVLRSGPMDVGLVGYGVVPEFRGRGFTTKALRLVSRWIFESTTIGRLELGHKVANVASGKAAMSAGFVHEATLAGRLRNHDGSFSDEEYYGLVRP
jgi:RimJ/RimL family protein N-acetyltransferase